MDNTSGCILVGNGLGKINGQEAITKSGAAMYALRKILEGQELVTLTIEELWR